MQKRMEIKVEVQMVYDKELDNLPTLKRFRQSHEEINKNVLYTHIS